MKVRAAAIRSLGMTSISTQRPNEAPPARVLVTGAAGFMGSHVADACLALEMDVVATDDLSGGYRENVPEDAVWVQGDLRDASFVTSLWDDGPFDYVYHLGAYAAEGLSHFIRAYNYRTNLEASVNLINCAVKHGVRRFVFTSSIAVYGVGPGAHDRGPHPVARRIRTASRSTPSNSTWRRRTRCSAWSTRLPSAQRLRRAAEHRGQVSQRHRHLHEQRILRGMPMPMFGDGLQTRAFSHVDDVAPIIARSPLVPTRSNEIFNIGADTPYSVLELAQVIAEAFDVEPDVLHLDARNEVVDAFSDHSKVHRVFTPPEALSLREGIARMARWVAGPRSDGSRRVPGLDRDRAESAAELDRQTRGRRGSQRLRLHQSLARLPAAPLPLGGGSPDRSPSGTT